MDFIDWFYAFDRICNAILALSISALALSLLRRK